MIFISTADATISASVPSMVAQGSILANEVMLLAPFAASTSVTCAFILPNGVRTQEQLAEPAKMVGIDGIPPIKDDLGRYYNAWRYTLDGALTEYAGDVTVQFFFRNGSVALASSASTFNVQAGVPVDLPDEPSQDIYDQILRALSSLGARIDQTDANVAGLTSFVNSIFERVESADSKNAQQDGQIADLQQYKVDRIFPVDETRVYTANPTGDGSYVLSLVPRPLSVPEYDDGGRLESNDPTYPKEVANKRYVDEKDDLDRAYTNSNAVFSVDVSVNEQTYVLTATAKNATGNVLSQSSVDLPLESMVVGAEVVTVDGVDKLRLILQNGNTVDIDVRDIVDGLATKEDIVGLLKNNATGEKAVGVCIDNPKTNATGTHSVTIGGGPFPDDYEVESKRGFPYNINTGYKGIAVGSGAWVVACDSNGSADPDAEEQPSEAMQFGTGINSKDNTVQFGGENAPTNKISIFIDNDHAADKTASTKLSNNGRARSEYNYVSSEGAFYPLMPNQSTGKNGIALVVGAQGGESNLSGNNAIAIGIADGGQVYASAERTIAIGKNALATAENAMQFGLGSNSVKNSVNFGGTGDDSSRKINSISICQDASHAADGVEGRHDLATEAWVQKYIPLSIVDGKINITFEEE